MTRKLLSLAAVILILTWMIYADVPVFAATTQSSAVTVTKSHPSGCLYAESSPYTIEGYLVGTINPAASQEKPPIPSQALLFLQLKHSISVCAFYAGTALVPAYVNVRRIGLARMSVTSYQQVMKKWGKSRILITGVLSNSSLGSPARPGPILFVKTKQFCYSGATESTKTVFHCIPWKEGISFEEYLRK